MAVSHFSLSSLFEIVLPSVRHPVTLFGRKSVTEHFQKVRLMTLHIGRSKAVCLEVVREGLPCAVI